MPGNTGENLNRVTSEQQAERDVPSGNVLSLRNWTSQSVTDFDNGGPYQTQQPVMAMDASTSNYAVPSMVYKSRHIPNYRRCFASAVCTGRSDKEHAR